MSDHAEIERALAIVVEDGRTLRQWLRDVLLTLWDEGEGFSGKRPFGGSSFWWSTICETLEDAGFEDGDAIVIEAINYLFSSGERAQ